MFVSVTFIATLIRFVTMLLVCENKNNGDKLHHRKSTNWGLSSKRIPGPIIYHTVSTQLYAARIYENRYWCLLISRFYVEVNSRLATTCNNQPDFPTPPEPNTTSLHSFMATCRHLHDSHDSPHVAGFTYHQGETRLAGARKP